MLLCISGYPQQQRCPMHQVPTKPVYARKERPGMDHFVPQLAVHSILLSTCQSCLAVRCCCGRQRAGDGRCNAARGWRSTPSSMCRSLAGAEGRSAQRRHEHVLPAMYQIHIEQHKAPHIVTGVQSERPTFGKLVCGSGTLPDALQALSQVYGVSDPRT